jgi:autotransporter-associated beta strand protein
MIMRKIYVVFVLLLIVLGATKAQTTFDWLNTAPDGNWRQGAFGARWNPGGLFDEPGFGVLRFDNNNQLTMTNNVTGTYNQFMMVFAAGNTNPRTIGGNNMRFFDFSGNNPKIENFSSANHVVNLNFDGDGDAADPLEINFYNSGNLTFNGNVNNRGSFINLFGTASPRTAEFNGVVSGGGGFGVNQGEILLLNNTNTYTGNTEVNRGELWINTIGNAIANNNIFIGNGTASADVAKIFLSRAAGGTNFTRSFTINPGNSTTRFIGSLNTSGTNEFSGVITNNSTNGLEVEVVNAAGTLLCSNNITGTSAVTKIGAGILEFSGTAKTYTGSTIVNSGVLRLAAANQIANVSNLQLNGGTFSTGATTAFSETLGQLQLTGNSIIALGTGISTLRFAASNGAVWTVGTTLTITGWRGECFGRIFVGTSSTDLTPAQLAQITFVGYGPGATLSTSGELLPNGYSAPLADIWTGAANSNWNNATNWCDNTVPTLSDNVLIPTGAANYPVIATGQFATCGNIEVENAASVTVTGTGLFTLYGNITNTGGVFDVTDGNLAYADAGGLGPLLILSGNTIFNKSIKNLIIGSYVEIGAAANNGDTVKVTGFVSFSGSNRTLNANGNLTLVSNAAGTASIADATNNGTVTGNVVNGQVNVERYIETNRKWRFLSINTFSPQTIQNSWMEGQTPGTIGVNGRGTWITDPAGTAQGFDAASITASMKYWNGTGYTDITNPTTFNIADQPAYMIFIRGDRNAQASNATLNTTVLRTKGNVYQNNYLAATIPVFPTIRPVPNVYPSAVDLTKLQYSVGGTITVYVWDPKGAGSQGFGNFKTLQSTGPGQPFILAAPGGGSYGTPGDIVNVIESGQGFFVQGVGSPRDITFVEAAKNPKERDVFFTHSMEQTLDAQLSIVENNGNTVVDGVRSVFHKANSNAFDFNDAQKMLNNNENVSIKVADKLLSVDRRNIIVSDDTVHLNLANVRLKNYQWKFNLSNLDEPGREAFLLDRFNNSMTALNLNGSNTYNFTIVNTAASYANNRFAIVFKQNAVALPIVKATTSRLTNGKVAISFNTEKESYVDSYVVEKSTDGINFTSVVANENPSDNNGGNVSYVATDGNAASKEVLYYRIFAKRYAGGNVYSNIAKVNADVVDSYVKIYPNPVTNKVALLEVANKPAGNYTVQIADAKGRIVQKASITIVNNLERKKLMLNNTITAGIYSLILAADDGTSSVEKMIVQ